MKSLLILVLQFLRNPSEESIKNQSFLQKAKWLLFLFILEIPIIILLSYLQNLPHQLGFIDASQHRNNQLLDTNNLFALIFVSVLLIPFLEEAICRLPLKIKPVNFVPLIFLGIFLNGIFYIKKEGGGSLLLFAIPLSFTIILSIVVFRKTIYSHVSVFIRKNYGLYFYVISAIFALMHLFNFQFNIYVLIFAPLLVLPQFAGGIFMGFLRLKSGFLWGVLLHMLHNALFLLPAYLIINSTVLEHKTDIKRDGYQIKIIEGKSKQKEISGFQKVTPNEIILYNSFENIIAKLNHADVRHIQFKNPLLAKKKISLAFKNDSAFFSEKTDSVRHYALVNLLNNYDLSLKTKEKWASSWYLRISNEELFNKLVTTPPHEKTTTSKRAFYGHKDTINAYNINSKYLTRLLEQNLNINVENNISEYQTFSIRIPNNPPSKLNRYLDKNYGMKLQPRRTKIKYLTIE